MKRKSERERQRETERERERERERDRERQREREREREREHVFSARLAHPATSPGSLTKLRGSVLWLDTAHGHAAG